MINRKKITLPFNPVSSLLSRAKLFEILPKHNPFDFFSEHFALN